MDTKKCEAFLVAAESGSFTSAAHILGYTQVGITRLIAGLEEELGFPLFSRNKRGVVLTENGKMMLPVLKEVVDAGLKAEQLGSEINGIVSGVITIGSYFSISAMWLPEIIKRFRQRYPDVRVRMMEGGNKEMSRWLSEGSVDCCFLANPGKSPWDWTSIFKDQMVAWLPKDHELAKADSFPIERLCQEPFIHTQPGEDTEIDRLIHELDLHPDVAFTTRDAFTTYNMVAAGLGISVNQRLISKEWGADVAEIPLNPPQYVDLGIAVPSKNDMSLATRRFIECAREMLE